MNVEFLGFLFHEFESLRILSKSENRLFFILCIEQNNNFSFTRISAIHTKCEQIFERLTAIASKVKIVRNQITFIVLAIFRASAD